MSETLMNQLTPVSAGESQIDEEAKDIETYENAGQAEPSKEELKTPSHLTYSTWKTCSGWLTVVTGRLRVIRHDIYGRRELDTSLWLRGAHLAA
ncbi:hypothetical protein PGTUg99_013977 [Puccinia graminis f. sp. tritici]|uniref:Uncharacterized protein n=1 Tax=Puccinia graminis f. sp. tritici TaxID=56615 RepID=A0A5B0M8F2_PUCGR|nr:hypothetical protein PGTUg99_013977 [Puccinia graminis f. sp. tritici]